LVWSAEVALVRLSALPPAPRDLLLSAVCLGVLVVLPAALLALLPLGESMRLRLLGCIAALPAAFVAAGLFGFAAGDAGGVAWLAALAIAPLLLGAALARRAAPGRLPGWLPIGAVAAAALLAWHERLGGVPPLRVLFSLVAVWLVFAAAAALPRGRLAVALAALLLALVPIRLLPGAPLGWSAAAAAPDGPDVVLIVVDTLRADVAREMRSYARLAEQGAVFEQAQASASWTLPSMATLHTGLPVSGHGAGRLAGGGRSAIRASAATLAERFAAHGYDTAAVVAGNLNTSPRFGFGRGFAVFDYNGDLIGHHALPVNEGRPAARPVALHALVWAAPEALRAPLAERIGYPLAEGAVGLVDRASLLLAGRRDRPLFLWVHALDPHRPYKHVQSSDLPAPLRERLGRFSIEELRSDSFWSTREGRDALWQAYRHEVARLDRELLRLLDALGPAPPRGRVVVFTSDHGEEFLDHGALEHGHTLYQELLAVPLVVSGVERREETQVAGLVDVAPTLLALAKIPAEGLPGRNLLGAAAPATYTAQNLLYGAAPNEHFAVRRGRWKLLSGPAGRALFDLDTDHAESRDRSAERPELAAELLAWDVGPGAAGRAETLEAGEREALRELGYLE
jgi:arylsulfatase A-like enzyme